jgi:hypothetical protein
LAASVRRYAPDAAQRRVRGPAFRACATSCAAFDGAFVLTPVRVSSDQFAARLTRKPAAQST